MAEKDYETWLYTDKKITVKGQTYDVTLVFPVPENGSETAAEKLKHLINGEKAS